MISLSPDFDLGQDRTRIKDRRDGERQTVTAKDLLSRLFNRREADRWELQLLADEVGMGKTFVALAVAYSVLQAMSEGRVPEDLRGGCYRKILIVTPQNHSLFKKWQREVGEFVQRCVSKDRQQSASSWFRAVTVERVDELAVALRKTNGAGVIIARTSIFSDQKLKHYDLKRRFLLGALFRHWGNRFNRDARERLLRGAPAGWPQHPNELTQLDDRDHELVPWSEAEVLTALGLLDRASCERQVDLERLLELCREVATPYNRNRSELFSKVGQRLTDLYKHLSLALIRSDLPLVIVDEAHNWKNGPNHGTNGYYRFRDAIASRCRRLLLLTATPFQLRPSELLELLRISEALKPCPTQAASDARVKALAAHREQVVQPVLQASERASRAFSRAWSRLPRRLRGTQVEELWASRPLALARDELRRCAEERGSLDPARVDELVRGATGELDPEMRLFFREAMKLYAFNRDLGEELGKQVVRHRRKTEHRLVRVGEEYLLPLESTAQRPDRHVLHAAAGIDVRGSGELPHYVLMRCVSEMHRQERRVRRSSLGSALTGCYSTLLDSAEGASIKKALPSTAGGRVYLDLLMKLVNEDQDGDHPKVKALVGRVVEAWRQGEKSLIFCFRSHTAKRLRDILTGAIQAELQATRQRCLGGESSMRSLRGRLTRRDGDLVVLGLDRVLWSYAWALAPELPLAEVAARLALQPQDVSELARLGLTYAVSLDGEDVDRVFLTRAVEHVVAKRLLAERSGPQQWRRLLAEVAEVKWVEHPYGIGDSQSAEEEGDDRTSFNERGVNRGYPIRHNPSETDVVELAEAIMRRRDRARRSGNVPVVDGYTEGPSLWLGENPVQFATGAGEDERHRALSLIHRHLKEIATWAGEPRWEARRLLVEAMRRAVLRESVLVRLLPERADREASGWGELLVTAFLKPLPSQHESMAHRIGVFLEDVRAAGGDLLEPGSARHAFLEATRLRESRFVSLVQGTTDLATRERAFAGFNTPLLPEVLICTSVGAEGIDLHRHCRSVVHYDLAWNPAVLEQRTGRVDRIGSKTFRERERAERVAGSFLEVAVPFLAGTYDERMYEELRLRAQMFEVLTGGDVSADNVEGRDDEKGAEGAEAGVSFVPLPPEMIDDLRVRLHVWEDGSTPLEPVARRRG